MTKPSVPSRGAAGRPVLVQRDGGVLTVTMHRPEALNAFDAAMKPALLAAVRDAADDPGIRAVVLTGAGSAFGAGQDLKEHLGRVAAGDPTLTATLTEFYNPLILAITEMPKPVIAAIGGAAAGAGAALAFACDLRIASTNASFSMAFARAGLSADSGASYTLPRLIGRGRALSMMLTGRRVAAAEAHEIGLVDEVVPPESLDERAAAIAHELAAGPAGALGWIKASVRFAESHSLAETLTFENRAQVACFASADHREALDAFVAKRRPVFPAAPRA